MQFKLNCTALPKNYITWKLVHDVSYRYYYLYLKRFSVHCILHRISFTPLDNVIHLLLTTSFTSSSAYLFPRPILILSSNLCLCSQVAFTIKVFWLKCVCYMPCPSHFPLPNHTEDIMCRVQIMQLMAINFQTLAVLTKGLHGFTQSLLTNSGTLTYIRSRMVLAIPFPIIIH